MAKKTYEVVGPHAVLGNQPASTFQADLDPDQEARLVEGGHIAAVTAAKTEKEK